MTQQLALGRIIWAEITDANGFVKLRPAAIVTPTDQLTAGSPFDAVAITSRIPDPLPDDHVLLPWHRQGHPRTRLNRKCAAVCSWLAQILPSAVKDVAGIVPAPEMTTILTKIAARSPPVTVTPSKTKPNTKQTPQAASDTASPSERDE
ncbi:MAG TPA: hypothetical protein PK867_12165 [Pirellulales bacterium]|nr:hypothetical protein [Pirellulales bacterium]